jgi:exodeoxyribonuclease X
MLLRCVDFETTGFPPDAGIVEVGTTDVTIQEDGEIVIGHPWSIITNPDRPIEIAAMAIHHIQEADIIGREKPEEVLTAISKEVDYFVAHNAKFEQEFFSTPIPWICTYKCALRLVPTSPNHQNQTLRYFLKTPVNPELCQPAHRAGPDSYVTAHTLAKFLQDFKGKLTPELMSKWSSLPPLMPTCPIGKFRGKPWADVERGFLAWCTRQPTMEADILWNVKRELDRRDGKNA